MCFMRSPKPDNSAQVLAQQEADTARQREEERQTRIGAGMDRIRAAFAGFDDGYFDRFGRAFRDANTGQIGQQEEDEKRSMFFGLGRAGLENSSVGNEQRARLLREQATRRGGLELAVADTVGQRRGEVANARQGLETQLRATEDADAAASNATAQVRALDRPAQMTTGQWLTPVATNIGTGINAYNTGRDAGYYREMGTRLFPDAGGRGSVKVRS